MQASPIRICHLGTVEYRQVYEAMKQFTKERLPDTIDEMWIVQHPPVFTLGLAGDPKNLHQPNALIPLIAVDRGGEITYHGPGQVLVYLMLDLKRKKLFVKELVQRMEQAVIDTLSDFSVLGQRKVGAPGIYITEQGETNPVFWGAKIAALGLKITKQCSYHGLALNVDMDLRPFQAIHPCGYEGLQTVDLKSLGISENSSTVVRHLMGHLQRQLYLEPVL